MTIADFLPRVVIGCSTYRVYKDWKIGQVSWNVWLVCRPNMEYAFSTSDIGKSLKVIDELIREDELLTEV